MSQWRLPTKEELVSLYHHTITINSLRKFGGVSYWCDAPDEPDFDEACAVEFTFGKVIYFDKNHWICVILVRDNGDKLEWSSILGQMNWFDAKEITETYGQVFIEQERL